MDLLLGHDFGVLSDELKATSCEYAHVLVVGVRNDDTTTHYDEHLIAVSSKIG